MKISKRSIVIAAIVAASLLTIQLVTYFWYAEAMMPVSAIKHVVDYGWLRDPGSGKEYVVVSKETWDSLTNAQKAALEEELKGTVVYRSVDEVPDEMKLFREVTEEDVQKYERWKKEDWISPRIMEHARKNIEAGRELIAFKNGFKISWKLERSGPFWMTCSSSTWVASLGACWSGDVFVWVLGFWVRVYNFHRSEA